MCKFLHFFSRVCVLGVLTQIFTLPLEMLDWMHGRTHRQLKREQHSEYLKGILKSKMWYKQLKNCELSYICRSFPGSSVGKDSACNVWDPCSIPVLGRSAGEGIGYPLHSFFPCGSAVKNLPEMQETGLGRDLGQGKGYPLQYSGLENSMECTVQGVTKSRTWLSEFHSYMYEHTLVCVWLCIFS